MALHNGIDTIGYASLGVFTKTYGAGAMRNICNLFASLGVFEDATKGIIGRVIMGIAARAPGYLFAARNPGATFSGKAPGITAIGEG